LVFFVCLGLIGKNIYAAVQSKPLLISGKRTLYQKVITHPGTKLYAAAGDSAQVLNKWIKPFTVFYVYQRVAIGGKPWLEIGLSSTEGAIGWIKGSKASDWNQALTLVFTERTGRQPALFFKNMSSLGRFKRETSPGLPNSRLQRLNHRRKLFQKSDSISCRFFSRLNFLRVLNFWKLPLSTRVRDNFPRK
jgi:hypothetical protein